MNHKNFVPLFCVVFFALVLGSCVSSESVQEPVVPEKTPLFTGDGGKGISLAILAPDSRGLTEEQDYIPALVQGEFVSNFASYSAISVLDRQRLDAQYAEIFSGYYDDDSKAGADLGHLIPTELIMGGVITKTVDGYVLQIQITKTSDKTTIHSYSGNCTFEELNNLTGVRKTSLDLLAKMGVQLSTEAKNELSGAAAVHEVQGQTALAQGLTAQRGGTEVQALSYYLQSANYDPGLIEAASRVNILTANITSGNMGQDIRNDIAWRDQWRARLAEAEQVYADYIKQQPLYSLVYDVNLKHGETNYSNNTVPISGVTIDLVPDVAWFNTAGSVVRVINVVREGLLATGQADKWGMNWPKNTVGNSPFGDRDQRFDVVVELVNSEGKTIGSERITMQSGYDVEWWRDNTFRRLIPRLRGVQNLGFSSVNAYDITDSLTVRIARIDGVDAETAAKTKSINILREAAYAQLPDVIAGVDSRKVARLSPDLVISASGEITEYKGSGGRIIIPPTVFGLPVTSIGKEAFSTKHTETLYTSQGTRYTRVTFSGKGLTGVTIPSSVTRIGANAFNHNHLTSIIIPTSVTSIGFGAFEKNNFTSITIPYNVTIPSTWGMQISEMENANSIFGDSHTVYYNNSFEGTYNKNGKKAGTYTRTDLKSRKWTYRP
ncbi:leucine-rich repeat domain-containing protein [Treponema primitia]|uniref:leucine-rich repeat domain-containing protein n=1 Tax=Treponema primitia TaxID=88058 RepID=UPI00397FBEE3